jgi:hypothetical protein
MGLGEGVIEERTVRPPAGCNGCPAFGILPPAAAVAPEAIVSFGKGGYETTNMIVSTHENRMGPEKGNGQP